MTRGGRLASAAGAVLLALLALEATSRVALRAFPAVGGAIAPTGAGDGSPRPVEAHLKDLAVHPYLGYVADPDRTPGISADGFPGDPFRPRAGGEAVVALIGGSVANQLALTPHVAREIGRSAWAGGRRVRIVNLTMGGYRQPQQLLELTYLLARGARFDAVVSVDGFNEVALPVAENAPAGVSLFYPRQWHLLLGGAGNRERDLLVGRIAVLDDERAAWARRGSSWSGTVRLVAATAVRRLDARLSEARVRLGETRFDASRLDYAHRGPPARPGVDPYQELAGLWEESSRQVRRLCAANGIAYRHALQPNQYFPAGKPFGDEERRVALNERSPYRPGVVAGYPRLVEAGARLKASGDPFVDLTGLFAGDASPVYGDSCCHFLDDGLRRIAAAIGAPQSVDR